jgi:hypothetical protein
VLLALGEVVHDGLLGRVADRFEALAEAALTPVIVRLGLLSGGEAADGLVSWVDRLLIEAAGEVSGDRWLVDLHAPMILAAGGRSTGLRAGVIAND